MNVARAIGGQAARAAFGLRNSVNWVKARPNAVQQAVTSPGWWRSQGRGLAQTVVGQPRTVAQQFSEGSLHKPGGLLHESLRPRGAMDALYTYGLPALSIYSAAQAPANMRGSSVGNVIGSTAGALLGRPLGMIGQIGGSMLLGNVGSTLGSLFDDSTPRAPANDPADDQPSQYRTLTRARGFGV